MAKFWNKWAPYWHICTALLFGVWAAITWVDDVSAMMPAIAKLKEQQQSQHTDIAIIKNDVAVMREQVRDIWEMLHQNKNRQ